MSISFFASLTGCKYIHLYAFLKGRQKAISPKDAEMILAALGGDLPDGIEKPLIAQFRRPCSRVKNPKKRVRRGRKNPELNPDPNRWVNQRRRLGVHVDYPSPPTDLPLSEFSGFSVWKTIELGLYPSWRTMRTEIQNKRCVSMEYWPDFILRDLRLCTSRVHLDLVVVTPQELGFSEEDLRNPPSHDDWIMPPNICQRGKQFGLGVCPPEIAYHLLLEHGDKIEGKRMLAMDPITTIGNTMGFSIEKHSSRIYLSTYDARFGPIYKPDSQWIFVDLRSIAPKYLREVYIG
jgi:hypothetical protein